VVHSHFDCRNTIFRCSSLWGFSTFVASVTGRRSFAQNAFEAKSGNWSRCTRACRTRIQKAVRIMRTGASPPATAAGSNVYLSAPSAAAGTGACMTCMVRTVATIHVRQAQVHLPRLPLSASKASLAKLLLHRHPSQSFPTCPKYKKTRRRLHGLNPGPSQWKFNHRTVLDSKVVIS